MKLPGGVLKIITGALIERPANRKTLSAFTAVFEESARQIAQRIETAAHTRQNHAVVTHIIGIERWGQRRLRVALGEPFVAEEYNGYRLPREATWDELKAVFVETRRQTVDLTSQLEKADPSVRILHNTYGDLSVRGWLYYLNLHASWESRKLKSQQRSSEQGV